MAKAKTKRTVAEAIVDARLRARLQQRHLAQICQISSRTLGRWEHGTTVPAADERRTLVEGLTRYDVGSATQLAADLGIAAPGAGDQAALEDASRRAVSNAVTLAADALDVSPRRTRAALILALRELAAAGVGVNWAIAALCR